MSDPRGRDGELDDVTKTAAHADAALPVATTLSVTVIEGPDAGRSITLDPDAPARTIVGSAPTSDFVLSDPTVSRRHLSLEPAGKRFRIIDLESRNGTFVDGVSVVEAYVNGGEIVRCGSTALELGASVARRRTLPSTAMGWGKLIGASDAMRRLYLLCERLAAAPVPILIEGETGTGKEVLAESMHEMGRRSGAFVVFDCTAVANNLLEAELFGHERGAFTGAVSSRPGLFEQADGGTLLIDEIGELDLPLQAKLLRAVDRGEFRRVGGRKTETVDCRILAATRRNLDREVEAGRFRDDLLHRLAIARIELPPLRERGGDVSLLARHFASELDAPAGTLDAELLARYEDYHWPGNVRELKNTILRRIVYGEGAPIGTHSIPPGPSGDWVSAILAETDSFSEARRLVIEEFERRFVEQVLERHGGNVTRAAAAAGIAARYLRMLRSKRAASE
jgi:DNA-binding NtrC family response regulator